MSISDELSGYASKIKQMKLDAANKVPPVVPPVIPPPPTSIGGVYVFVKWDTKPRNKRGAPAVYPTLACAWVKGQGAVLDYLVEMQHLMAPRYLDVPVGSGISAFEREMRSLWRSDAAFSNRHPWGASNFAIQGIYTTGATFRAITGKPYFARLRWWIDVYALDPLHLPSVPTNWDNIDWTLHFHPTSSTDIEYGNTIRTNPFPQFDGASIIPFFGAGGVQAIQFSNIKFLPDKTIPNPYNPPQ